MLIDTWRQFTISKYLSNFIIFYFFALKFIKRLDVASYKPRCLWQILFCGIALWLFIYSSVLPRVSQGFQQHFQQLIGLEWLEINWKSKGFKLKAIVFSYNSRQSTCATESLALTSKTGISKEIELMLKVVTSWNWWWQM